MPLTGLSVTGHVSGHDPWQPYYGIFVITTALHPMLPYPAATPSWTYHTVLILA